MVSYPNPCYSETYYNEVELYFYENILLSIIEYHLTYECGSDKRVLWAF